MKITSGSISRCFFLFVLSVAFSLGHAQTLDIPQVVDGGAWQTTIALTNTSASQTVVSLTFFQNTTGGATASWNLAFRENVQLQSLILPGGSTLFLHTPDTAASPTVGWGQVLELDGSGVVVAYATFTQLAAGTLGVGTALASVAVSRILVPFDNTNGAATSMAVVNPGSSSETINVGIRIGSTASQPAAITLPPNGHVSFDFSTQFSATANQSGLAEFYSPNGTFAILALRFQSGALTTAPVFSQTGPPIIASASSSGGGSGGIPSGNIVAAYFSVGKINTKGGSILSASDGMDTIGGSIGNYTPAEWNVGFSMSPIGSCIPLDVTYSGNPPFQADSYLDAGIINVSGNNIAQGTLVPKAITPLGPVYILSTSGTLQPGGTYTLTGLGGPQVNAFSTTAPPIPNGFAVTNWDQITSINRASGLTIDWTGSGFDHVSITIFGTTFGASYHEVGIACVASASSGTFTVPPQALSLLPAVQAGSTTGNGQLSVTAFTAVGAGQVSPVSTTFQTFTPTLANGNQANYGSFSSSLGVNKSLPIQ
ncbi:MAG TPA: hypothetical protein VG096_19210 [Bryobacteraceae bacterium]|nr:hypothetical protein [Bryobacteraceae bacterium]